MLFYVRDMKNVGTKKAMDVVHKEKLITTMRNASSSCSIPVVKSFQNGYADKNSKETIPSGLVVNHSEGRNSSIVPVQQNTSKCVSSNGIASGKESSHENNIKVSTLPSVTKKENSLITRTDLDGMVQSATKFSNGDHSGKIPTATASAVCCVTNGEKEFASVEKPSISNFPSSANILCNKESHMVIFVYLQLTPNDFAF